MFHELAAVFVLLLSACDAPANERQADDPPIAAAVRAATAEMFAYSEGVLAIVREHREDCDAIAARLAERVPTFRKLGPRIMAIKEQMKSLSESEREALEREADREAERFRTRVPDFEELERVAKQCATTSPAFARIAPQVMLSKKK